MMIKNRCTLVSYGCREQRVEIDYGTTYNVLSLKEEGMKRYVKLKLAFFYEAFAASKMFHYLGLKNFNPYLRSF